MSTTPPPPPPPPSGGAPPPPPPMGEAYGSGGPTAPGGRPLAEPWMRVIARLLDGIIVGIVINQIVFRAVTGESSFSGDIDNIDAGEILFAGVIMLAIGFVWDPVLTKQRGGSPMKLVFGMNVVRAGDGAPVSWGQAISRWAIVAVWGLIPILIIAVAVPLILVIVSLVFLFSQPLRQTIWDKVAKTNVVSVR